MTNYVDPIEQALSTDQVAYHQPEGTSELSQAIGSIGQILYRLGGLTSRIKAGTTHLPDQENGLRTDTMAGLLDPDQTKAEAVEALSELTNAIATADAANQRALNKLARLYIDQPPSVTPVRPVPTPQHQNASSALRGS